MGKRGNPNWKKGVSANPGGRRKVAKELRARFGEVSDEAREVLLKIMRDPEAENRDRTAAAKLVLEYGIGKPATEIDEKAEVEIKTAEAKLEMLKQGQNPDAPTLMVIPETLLRDDERRTEQAIPVGAPNPSEEL